MTLLSGSLLGPYEILSLIGAGGMGEIYKAKDTRLDRIVAIKVLPTHLSDNAERRERFEREARAVSSLNHPNICTLHDIGEQDGTHYLVMEYIDGETLTDRLTKGALPFDQALRHGIEIADALDKAHRQGVVHRDLKPGNIMLTKTGAKLLDFGLAKLKAPAGGQDVSVLSALPTEQKPLTREGSILGTFQYMAPEQLEGKEADTRTDIFAFGSVLYEMVTGKKAFEGKSQASLISAIMSADPPRPSSLQPVTPTVLDHAVKRCLAKDPEDRWLAAHDLMHELKWIAEGGTDAVPASSTVVRQRLGRPLAIGIVAALFGALVASFAFWTSSRPAEVRSLMRFEIPLASRERLFGNTPIVAISPEGKHLVYVANRRLFLRPMNQLEATFIPGTEEGEMPFFSPDGLWIGFWVNGQLKKVSLSGGTPETICDAARFHSGHWGEDGTITFARGDAILQVSDRGGNPQVVVDAENGELLVGPSVLPGGRTVLFSVTTTGLERTAAVSLDTGERWSLDIAGDGVRYLSTGHFVYCREGTIWAVPFSLESMETSGSPVPVVEGVMHSPNGPAQFRVSKSGSLVYVPGSAGIRAQNKLVWVDREGVAAPLAEAQMFRPHPRLSPNGKRLAVTVVSTAGTDVWIVELNLGTMTRSTFEGSNLKPLWSPDGERILFGSNRVDGLYQIFSKPADGSGAAEQLTTGAYRVPTSISSDGKTIVFRQNSGGTGLDIGMLRLEGDSEAEMLLQTSFEEHTGKLSPDDRWLAYVSNESGREEVYVRPFPGPGGRRQVSTEGGTEPVWSPDGSELFYRNGEKMMAVVVTTEPEFTAGRPSVLFEGGQELATYGGRNPSSNYDVTPDGQKFVMVESAGGDAPVQLHLVLDWFEELKRLVPAN